MKKKQYEVVLKKIKISREVIVCLRPMTHEPFLIPMFAPLFFILEKIVLFRMCESSTADIV